MVFSVSKKDWDPRTWRYPLVHNYEFGFGLSADATTKASTMVPYMFQDNAIVDYETIKTNPENADFAVMSKPNICAGSYVPKIMINYTMYIPPSDTELVHLKANTMKLSTAMLNRLDAFDKKTGNDIETILELQHETTDEQVYPLWNGTKLFETGGTFDYHTDVPGLTTDQQPEGIAFDKEMFFDGLQYYTNGAMLKNVTAKMKDWTLSEPLVPHGRSIISRTYNGAVPSLAKFGNPYQFMGEIFHVPQTGSIDQYHIASQTTGIEHLRVKGRVRFFEYNPDFNFSRA